MVKDQEEKNKESYEKQLEAEKAKSEQEVEELKKKLKETMEQTSVHLEKCKNDEENLQSELQTQKKLLESKERVAIRNLAEIQTQYNTLLQTTQDQDQILAENHRTITELIALAEKLEQEKKIVILERKSIYER
jgi:hypothetical protein